MKKLIYILLGVAVLCSCKNTPEETTQTTHPNIDIKWDDKQADSLASIAYDIKYIALETHPDGLFDASGSPNIRIKNDKIFILEKRKANAVFMFDISGRFERRIGKVGSGPGEYNMLWGGFSVDDKYVYLFDGPAKKVLKYDHQGNYIESLKSPAYALDMAVLDNGDFLLALNSLTFKESPQYRILITDNKMNVKKELFKVNNYDSPLTMGYNFTESNDKITFISYVQDTMVVFNKRNGDYSTIYFDFNKKVPLEKRTMARFAEQGDYEYLSSRAPLINGKYINGVIHNKPETIDTETGTVYSNGRYTLYGFPATVYKGYSVAPFTGDSYKRVVEKGNWKRAPKELDEFFMADPDNVGLVLYKLRQ